MHITASVFINDDERGLHQDYDDWLEELVPHEPISKYRHNRTGEDNADAHLKRQIMGREVVVAITDGRLDFGAWERIFYGEFDGRRQKRVLVKIIGEEVSADHGQPMALPWECLALRLCRTAPASWLPDKLWDLSMRIRERITEGTKIGGE
jgi:secondary thiamine-phosphate synthase enzyme